MSAICPECDSPIDVDEYDVDRLPAQRLGALQTAEAGPDDHDPRIRAHPQDCRMNASSRAYRSRTGPSHSLVRRN